MTQALQGQNVQVASGMLNQPPVANQLAFQIAVRTLGRLTDPDQFANIIVKQVGDAVVRVRDVARVELTAQDFSSNSYLDQKPAVAIAVFQRPGSNALATGDAVRATTAQLAKEFPPGLAYGDLLRPDPVHLRVGQRGDRHHLEGDRAGRPGGAAVPADLARGDHSRSSPSRCRSSARSS